MIIPLYGRVVVVDDKIEEITSLMTVLSKQGVSFTYFNGSVETLPPAPLKGTTFMFLDLELDDNSLIDNKTKASQDISVIQRILGENSSNKSVVIIVWSGALAILTELKAMIRQANIAPLALLEINKADCKENGNFVLEKIVSQIEQHLCQIPSLNLLTLWDNLVGQASHTVYKKIMPAGQVVLEELNKHLNSIYSLLAIAQLGEKNLGKDKAYAAINILNSILANEISSISNNGNPLVELDLENTQALSLQDLAQLNAGINMVTSLNCTQPGCIFENTLNDKRVTGFDIFEDINKVKSDYKTVYKQMIPICCEVTPLCDYVQKRAVFHRLVSGLVVPAVLDNYTKDKSDYLYKSPIFYVDGFLDNNPFFLMLDLRHFFTIASDGLDGKQPLFQLGESIVMHIQNRLGRQVSNPGITFIDNK